MTDPDRLSSTPMRELTDAELEEQIRRVERALLEIEIAIVEDAINETSDEETN